ncbi:MAG: transposase [Deltaproteobacteria bacterium]|nr:transposase [Deltaproteobacteria bacterium]
MPREKRDDFPGAWHHVFHRGARKAPIFKLPRDCTGFLEYLAEAVDRFQVEVHAYSLMPNHYHLLIRSVHGNLSEAMQYLNGSYTLWLNKMHRWDGPVFRGRFGSQLVKDDDYMRVLFAYIHLNPITAHLVPRITSESWTSYRAYVGKEPAPKWLHTDIFLDWFAGKQQLHQFVSSIHRGALAYPDNFDKEMGLFRKKVVQEKTSLSASKIRSTRKEKKKAIKRNGAKRLLSADEVLQDVYRITKCRLEDLMINEKGPHANPARRFAVWALARGSNLSQREIGKLLDVPYNQVTRLLSRLRKKPLEPVAGWIKEWFKTETG